jgi:hypothetical protein
MAIARRAKTALTKASRRKPLHKDTAVDHAVTEHRYRSLVAALDAVDRQFRCDGQPPRFDPLKVE